MQSNFDLADQNKVGTVANLRQLEWAIYILNSFLIFKSSRG